MFDLYNNIAQLCKEHGLSTTKACELAGLSRSTLSNLKNGRAQTLSVKNAHKIADVIGEPFDVVMHGRNPISEITLSPSKQAFIDEVMDLPDEKIKAITELVKAFKSGL